MENHMLTFNQLRAVIKNIKTNIACTQCAENFCNEDISVISCMHNKCMLAVECHACSNPLLITVTLHDYEDELGNNAEICIHDGCDLMPQTYISSDDVVGMNNFLQDFNGNFTKLFKSSKSSQSQLPKPKESEKE